MAGFSLVAYHCVNEHCQMLWIIAFLFELFNLKRRVNFYQSSLSLIFYHLPSRLLLPLLYRYRVSFSYVTLVLLLFCSSL